MSFTASVTGFFVCADCVLVAVFEGMYAWCAMSAGNEVCRSTDSVIGEDRNITNYPKAKLVWKSSVMNSTRWCGGYAWDRTEPVRVKQGSLQRL